MLTEEDDIELESMWEKSAAELSHVEKATVVRLFRIDERSRIRTEMDEDMAADRSCMRKLLDWALSMFVSD